MQVLSSKRRRLAATLAAASLAAALPVAATGTAEADPKSSRVTVVGTASCEEEFVDTLVTEVSITPKGGTPRTAELSGEEPSEKYSIKFTGIPKVKGVTAKAVVTCVDGDGESHQFDKNITIKRPAGTTIEQTVDLK
ncbi:hypothetical protein LG634_08660 [Streptomyces bambusae]|uniref:hypothetical protein n=1 Tax=Streptomyces bambusae TaxID=1550616 RepID=UPI001CFDE96A|nr:hypothetical protein [Streptomyces bambusae]MCB5164899.1 hypothetical protein [Streptomyces bambusae]